MMVDISEHVHKTCAKEGCEKMARWQERGRFYYYVCDKHKNEPPAYLQYKDKAPAN